MNSRFHKALALSASALLCTSCVTLVEGKDYRRPLVRKGDDLLVWFSKTFSNMSRDIDALEKERQSAKKAYPKLMHAYDLLGIYNRYLERRVRGPSSGLASYTPLPDGGGSFPFPPEFERDVLKELEEFAAAEIEAGAQWEAENREEIRTCDQILRDLRRALACVQRYSETLPANDEEWEEFLACIQELEQYAAEAEAHGCN